MIAAEDPPEYTAWLARHITPPEGSMAFYRRPIQLDDAGLRSICAAADAGDYGLILVSSWQSVIASLVENENDNAGAVRIMESVKAAARASSIPWLIDAHSGTGEDQSNDADPTRALRGASAAAGAADFMLSLRYASSPFSTQRRLSGKGRFVNFEPMLIDYDPTTGLYSVVSDHAKSTMRESTWRMVVETGAPAAEWQSERPSAGPQASLGRTGDCHRRLDGHCVPRCADAWRGLQGRERAGRAAAVLQPGGQRRVVKGFRQAIDTFRPIASQGKGFEGPHREKG